jgi:hypothetical protein
MLMKLPILVFVLIFCAGELPADSFESLAGVVITVSEGKGGFGHPLPGVTVEIDGARTDNLYKRRIDKKDAKSVKALVAEATLPKTTDSRGNCIVYAYGRGAGKDMAVHGKVKVSKNGYEPLEIDLSKSLDPTGLGTFKSFPVVNVSLKRLSEQGDAVQSATTVDSKSEGKKKAKPESEGRSQ